MKKKRKPANRSAKARTARTHRPRLIVKLGWYYVPAGDDAYMPIPRIVVLANSGGFRELAGVFRNWAKRADRFESGTEDVDPLNDLKHNCIWPPFDVDRTDKLEFCISALDPRCESEILERFNAEPENAERGDLVERYARIAALVKKQAARLERESGERYVTGKKPGRRQERKAKK